MISTTAPDRDTRCHRSVATQRRVCPDIGQPIGSALPQLGVAAIYHISWPKGGATRTKSQTSRKWKRPFSNDYQTQKNHSMEDLLPQVENTPVSPTWGATSMAETISTAATIQHTQPSVSQAASHTVSHAATHPLAQATCEKQDASQKRQPQYQKNQESPYPSSYRQSPGVRSERPQPHSGSLTQAASPQASRHRSPSH